MSITTTKKGLGYVAKWDSELDVLRIYVDKTPEPTLWAPLPGCSWFEVGFVASFDATESARKVVSLRMHEASKHPEIDDNAARTTFKDVDVTLLNMIRHGHAGVFKCPGVRRPKTFHEAANALAEAVQDGLFGPTRDIERRVRAAGYEDPREWIEDALNDFYRAQKP
jgi:hypothetical protein